VNDASAVRGGRRALERQLSIVLRHGTWLACALIAAGLGYALLDERSRQAGTALTSATQLVTSGIAVLLVLPVLRVVLMAVAFARQRDYLFVTIATLVLAVIGLGLAVGSK
jgi:uncharacterized membrane protein